MGEIYLFLLEAGFSADYLDRCTLLDIDLFSRLRIERLKKQVEQAKSSRS